MAKKKAARKAPAIAQKPVSEASPPDSAPVTHEEPPESTDDRKDEESQAFLIDLPHIRDKAAHLWPNSWQRTYLLALMWGGDHGQACKQARTDPAFVAATRDKEQEFHLCLTAIEDMRPQLVEASLFQLAQQGMRVEFYKNGELTRVEHRRDVRAIQLFLSAHHAKYGDATPDKTTPKKQQVATERALKTKSMADWLSKQSKKTAE